MRHTLPCLVLLTLILSLVAVGCGGSKTKTEEEGTDGGGTPSEMPDAGGLPSGSGDASAPRTPLGQRVEGRLMLPEGVRVASVINALSNHPADGETFTVINYDAGRQLAVALSEAGHPLLMGWVGPEHRELSTRTTAEVLAYFASGAFVIPIELHSRVLELWSEYQGLDGLVAALDGALRAHPEGFHDHNADVETALRSAVRGVLPMLEQALLRGAPTAFAILVNPAAEQSGIRLNTLTGINTLTFQNRLRRPSFAFVDRVSTIDENGNETASPAVIAREDIPSVTAVAGTVGTLTQFVTGLASPGALHENEDMAYVPRNVGPVDVPNVRGATRTRYRVAVVGPGVSQGDYTELTAAERDKQHEVLQRFVIQELILPLALQIILPASKLGESFKGAGGDTVVQDLAGIITTQVPSIWTKSARGDLSGAMMDGYNALVNSGTFRNAVLQVALDYVSQHALTDEIADQAFRNAESLLRVTGVVDSLSTAFDLTVMGAAIAESSPADVWHVDVIDAKVNLLPPRSTLRATETVALEVTIADAGEDAAFEYRYSLDHGLGVLENEYHRGRSITASSEHITFEAEAAGTEVVRVEVFEIRLQERVRVGEAAALIEITEADVSIDPARASLAAGESMTLTARVGGDVAYELPLRFRWHSTYLRGRIVHHSGGGALAEEWVSSATHSIDYQSIVHLAGGEELFTVQVQDANGEDIGTATARVQVGCVDHEQTAEFRLVEWNTVQAGSGYTYRHVNYTYLFDAVEGVHAYEMTIDTAGTSPGHGGFNTGTRIITPFQPTGERLRYYNTYDALSTRLPRLHAASGMTQDQLLYVVADSFWNLDGSEDFLQENMVRAIERQLQAFGRTTVTVRPACPPADSF